MRYSAIALLATTPWLPGAVAMAQPGTTGALSGQFMTEQAQGEYRASKFIGLSVYGRDNQRIGDINEILLDESGLAKAAVIGVGGFLGISEKNVAILFASLEWVNTPAPAASGMLPTGGQVTRAINSVTGAITSGQDRAIQDRSVEDTPSARGYPDHFVVRLSKVDLQQAPPFKYLGDFRASK